METIMTLLNSGALVAMIVLFVTGQIVARHVVSDIARAVACEILEELAKEDRLRSRVRQFAHRSEKPH